MKTIITSTEEIVDNETVNIWRIDKNDGTILINLNKLIGEGISECRWQDEKQKILIVEYIDWDSNELIAIVTKDGQIIRKGIRSIEEYIDKYGVFIIIISGFGLGNEAPIYDLDEDDWKMAAINKYGEFIIPPKFDRINFDEDDNILYAENYGIENKFSLSLNSK
jgi:hypothetical protein